MIYNKNEKNIHQDFMRKILEEINKKNLPTVLKGGTALFLCYNLDRFSEDIDLNSEKKFNLESLIKIASKRSNITIKSIKITKDSNTTRRYIISYNNYMRLKIETSFREKINFDNVQKINNIQVYNINEIAKMKLLAINGKNARTKARDLHDIIWIFSNYYHLLNERIGLDIIELSKNLERLFEFQIDYDCDDLLSGTYFEDLSKLEKSIKQMTNNNVLENEFYCFSEDEYEKLIKEAEKLEKVKYIEKLK